VPPIAYKPIEGSVPPSTGALGMDAREIASSEQTATNAAYQIVRGGVNLPVWRSDYGKS